MSERAETATSESKSDAAQSGCPFHRQELPYFPVPREAPLAPPAALGALLGESPIARVRLWNGADAWIVTRYDDIRMLLNDPRVSADNTMPGFPGHNPGMLLTRNQYRTFISMDPPEHTAQRRMLTGEFTVKRIEDMKPKIQAILDDLIGKLLAKPPVADFVEDLSLPLASLVICELLGVPYEDHEYFQIRAKKIASHKTTAEEAMIASRELCEGFIGDLIKKKDADPQDDLLSRLVVGSLRTGKLTHEQLVSMTRLVLVAGHETSASTMALGLVTLFKHPDQLEALRADPALAVGAVDEILRFVDVAHLGRRRTATADIEIGGQTIRAGEGIIAYNSSGNRDATIFAGPDQFDIRRDARHHLAFGYGIHQCLGQSLARAELQAVFSTLFQRIPTLRLAVPFEDLKFKEEAFVYGIESLPITW